MSDETRLTPTFAILPDRYARDGGYQLAEGAADSNHRVLVRVGTLADIAALGAALVAFAAAKPTGDRKPCGGWREHERDFDCHVLSIGLLTARVNRRRGRRGDGMKMYEYGVDGRMDGYGQSDDLDAAKCAIEDAARDLLLAGLRVLDGGPP